MRRWLVAGLAAGVVGLGLALLGDAVTVYRGLWVYIGLVPGVLGALWFGPGAGLVAGLLIGAAGGSPFVALAVGLWMALVGWLGARRWPGLTVFLSVPLVLAPLVALGYGLGDWRDPLQVWPLMITLAGVYLPTALAVGLVSWVGPAAWRRFGRRSVAVAALLLVSAFALPLPLVGHAAPAAAGTDGVRAAYIGADISPSRELLKQGIYMGGYSGRPGPAEGIHDAIWFRLMVLEQGSTRLLFVQTDTVGMGNRLYGRLRAAAAEAAGTPNVFIGVTHTHAGPDLQGLWGGVPTAYEDWLVERLRAAAAQAVGMLEPVELRVGTAQVRQATRNRRDWGVVPEQLHILQAVGQHGRPVATLVNFAAHPTVLPRENMQLSADFVGPLLNAPGGPFVFFNGAQGDVLPDTTGFAGSEFERAEAFGSLVARGVEEAVASARPVAPGPFSVRTETVHAPLENWQLALAMALGIVRYDISHAGVVPGVETQVSAIRIGPEVTLVTVPGEMMTRLWARIEPQLPAGRRFVLGLTHDSLGYIIPEDEWMSGRNRSYEESVSLGPVMAGLLERAVTRLLR